MNKALLEVTRVYSRSGVTMGTRLSLQSSGYRCDDTLVLVEALKQLRSEGPKKTSRVMLDVKPVQGMSKLLEQVMSMPQRVREKTTLVMAPGAHGIEAGNCSTMKAVRKRSGVGLAIMVESACWKGCLEALESIDAETVIVGNSLAAGHLDASCSIALLDIAELSEKKGARLIAKGDFTDAQMGSLKDAGVTAFLGRRFEASISIQSLEDRGYLEARSDNMVPDQRVKDLLRGLGAARALPN